jgi:hypothetical protein
MKKNKIELVNIVKDVPYFHDDPRGESCLIVGQGLDYRWIHVLCGNFYEKDLLIITVYIPKLPKWEDPFTRRV